MIAHHIAWRAPPLLTCDMPHPPAAAKLVRATGAEVRPHLPALVPALLEALSGLEDARLNYVEQHAERLGLEGGRLERARLAASTGGPVGEALDSCARYVDAASFQELAPRLAGLVRRGTGLNTRGGAARFISAVRQLPARTCALIALHRVVAQRADQPHRLQVTRRLGSEAQPVTPTLMKVRGLCHAAWWSITPVHPSAPSRPVPGAGTGRGLPLGEQRSG